MLLLAVSVEVGAACVATSVIGLAIVWIVGDARRNTRDENRHETPARRGRRGRPRR